MAHPAPGVLPQSGCAVIVQSHPNEAAEPSKCTKDPAFDARNAILDAIQNLTKEVRGVKNALRTRDINNVSRFANSQVNNPNDDLYPLCSIATGLPIPNFPQTPADMVELDSLSADTILMEPGADTTGRMEGRRRRLWTHAGLRPTLG